MIKAVKGLIFSAITIGNMIAIVPTGPIPGKTPIRVPINDPITTARIFVGTKMTEKP